MYDFTQSPQRMAQKRNFCRAVNELSRLGPSKSMLQSRPRAFQRATDEVRTLPPTPQRVAQKANLSFKTNK